VEFAIILPLFMMLVMGAIDFGYFLYVSEVVTNAAREGARAGSVIDPSCGAGTGCTLSGQASSARGEAQTTAGNYLSRGGLTKGGVIIASGVIQGGGADSACAEDVKVTTADSVCVDVKYPVGSVTGFLSSIMPTYSHAHAIMRWQ
jgi:hypothetical protein